MSHYILKMRHFFRGLNMVKFSEEICIELCAAHEEGLPQTDCADLVGINRKTIARWLEKGKSAKSGKHRNFYLNWKKAHAKFKRFHINKINKSNFWQASQYMLQVSDPDTFVVAEKKEVESKVDANVKQETSAEIKMKKLTELQEKMKDLNYD